MTAIDWTGWNSTSPREDFREDFRNDFRENLTEDFRDLRDFRGDFLQPGLPDWVRLYISYICKYS